MRTAWQRKWLKLQVHHPAIADLGDECEKWCGRFYHRNTSRSLLILAGPPGTGKSMCARRMYQWMSAIGPNAYMTKKWPNAPVSSFLRWAEVVDEIRSRDLRTVHEAFAVDGLVLDDIGADDDPFKQAEDKLCQILNRREKLFTIVTTNIESGNWSKKFDQRTIDRFMRNSVVVNLENVPSFAMIAV